MQKGMGHTQGQGEGLYRAKVGDMRGNQRGVARVWRGEACLRAKIRIECKSTGLT